MRFLLDTATFSNNALMPEVLPRRIRDLLDNDEIKGLCGVSLIELAIHHRLGRLRLAGSMVEFFDSALGSDIELLDITPQIAAVTNDFPARFPGDPFDRTIAATARVLNLTLITPDSAIRDSEICRVEFYPFRPSRT